jgi:hypothetical protein
VTAVAHQMLSACLPPSAVVRCALRGYAGESALGGRKQRESGEGQKQISQRHGM